MKLSDIIALFGATALSVLFTYVPGLRTKYAALDKTRKQTVMLGLLFVGVLVLFASSCVDLWVVVACDQAGALDIARAFVLAVIANQGTHSITPEPEDVGKAKVATW